MSSADTLLPSAHDSFILVVDDVPQNIQVVGGILTKAGYEVMPATSGMQALERVKSKLPDLILIDLMMPDMDGLAACRHLKKDPVTACVPIIFLTASNQPEHIVEAFTVGAVDYVTKPFNAPELLARVRTHLELKHTRDALLRQTERLKEMNEEKDEFLGIAAHDLRNPLSNIISTCQLLMDEPDADPAFIREMLDLIDTTATHMSQLVKNLLDVNAIEQGEMKLTPQRVSLMEIVESVLDSFRHKADKKGQTIQYSAPGSSPIVLADPDATREIVDNLISNAIKFSLPGKPIEIRLIRSEPFARLEVQDHGPGLTATDMQKAFGKFARLSARPTGGEVSIGLGLSIVRKMVCASHGRVWCESQLGLGATFIVEWPIDSLR